jgi:mycothiol synthase
MGAVVSFRPPRPDEAETVTGMLNAHALSEIGAEDTAAGHVRTSWDRPGIDRQRDLIVAEEGGRVVGYLEVDGEAPWTTLRIDGYVHPERWGRGIGAALLRRGEDRARELAARAAPGERVVLFHGSWHGTPAAALLECNGFALARVFLRMRIEMDAPPPRPDLPDGISIRTVVPGREERVVHQAMEEAFADHWNHRPVPFDRWLHDFRTHPGFDPDLWFVAMDDDQIAGVTICERTNPEEPDCGWVDDVAVRRPWRRRGIALALLFHSFGELYRRGVRKAALTVDAQSPTGATGLYEKAGMRLHRRIDVYGKELAPAVGREPSEDTDDALVIPRG